MPLPKEEHYTYADYCTWDDDTRWELIDGVPYMMYMMAPGPAPMHQGISVELAGQFREFLKGKPCKLYTAPFDVRLYGDGEDDDTVVQPDILVVCDRSKLDENGCNGAPDLVIEILSPSTARMDRVIKFQKYQNAGVREYWIVDPDSRTVSVYVLENGKYIASAYSDADTAPVHILEGCAVNLPDVFAQ